MAFDPTSLNRLRYFGIPDPRVLPLFGDESGQGFAGPPGDYTPQSQLIAQNQGPLPVYPSRSAAADQPPEFGGDPNRLKLSQALQVRGDAAQAMQPSQTPQQVSQPPVGGSISPIMGPGGYVPSQAQPTQPGDYSPQFAPIDTSRLERLTRDEQEHLAHPVYKGDPGTKTSLGRKIGSVLAGVVGGIPLAQEIWNYPYLSKQAGWQSELERMEQSRQQEMDIVKLKEQGRYREAQEYELRLRGEEHRAKAQKEEQDINYIIAKTGLTRTQAAHYLETHGKAPESYVGTVDDKPNSNFFKDVEGYFQFDKAGNRINISNDRVKDFVPADKPEKPTNYLDFRRGWIQDHPGEPINPKVIANAYNEERARIQAQYPKAQIGVTPSGKTVTVRAGDQVPPGTSTFSQGAQFVNQAYQAATKELDDTTSAYGNQLSALSDVAMMLDQGTAQSGVMVFPRINEALLAGPKTGFRMTKSEIDQAMGGLTLREKTERWFNQFGDAQTQQIPPEQEKALRSLVEYAEKKIGERQQLADEYKKRLATATSKEDVANIKYEYDEALRKLNAPKPKKLVFGPGHKLIEEK